MKIKGVIEIEVPEDEEQEFCENYETKDSILADLLHNAENFLGQEGVKIEVTTVTWIEQPKDEAFEDEDEDETEEVE